MAETASELRRQILLEHNEEQSSTSFHGGEKLIPIEEEMEDLHDGLSFGQFMVAGSVAGMVEHMAMFPVDTLKTRMQMLASTGGFSHSGMGKALLSIMRSEGPFGLYRGIGAMGLGAGPAHAVYFSVYELCKEKFGGNKPGHHPLVHAGSGVTATIASDAVFTPMDVVKQRLQLRCSPYRGVMDCITRMLKEEGIRAFYVSYRTTVVMNAPFTAMHFATYEAMKEALRGISPETASEENLFVHIMAGGVAGAIASAVTTPFDVVKTRLQCQGVCGADRFTSSSIRNAVQTIVAKEGPTALLKGLKPRVLFHAPAAAICWSTYEAYIGSLDGEEMSPPPPNIVVDPHEDAEDMMPDIADQDQQEAGANQSDATYRMELGDQLISLFFETGICPAYFIDIEADDRLLQMWRGMSRDMYNLMWHVVGVTTIFM